MLISYRHKLSTGGNFCGLKTFVNFVVLPASKKSVKVSDGEQGAR